MSKSLLKTFLVACLVPFVGAVSAAKADVAVSSATAVNVQNFHPATDMYGMFSVDSGDINPHLKVNAGLIFNYAWSPLSVVYSNTSPRVSAGEIVAHRFDANIVAAIGFWNYVELGLDIPVILFQSGLSTKQVQIGVDSESLQATNFGDITLTPKVRVVNYDQGRFSLALAMNIVFPTGNEKAFAGEAGFVLAPYMALSSTFDVFRFAVDLGYRWRDKSGKLLSLELDDEIFYKVGIGFNFGTDVAYYDVTAEIYGHTSAFNAFGLVSDNYAEAQNPMEALLGFNHTRVYHWGEIFFGGAVGFGLLPGYGTPKMRVLARAGYYMGERIDDADEDGIEDKKDKCPNEPEDIDGFEDEDGCPDKDNDKDGIPDEDDRCPNEAEDFDGFQDEDGCPDPDNDGDGILDAADACPNEPEDFDGFKDEDGCPDPDNDGDGILDAQDKCPNEKEDFDEFEDEDGCPDLDNDKDGIPDYGDLCPLQAEDMDGFEDEDGCPDPDNDGDGILDSQDKCPNEAEVINGVDDLDGCPDKGGKTLVIYNDGEFTLKAQPTFVPKKATLKPTDSAVLNQLAAILINHSEITKFKIQLYTTAGGNAKKNMALSKDQLATVVKYLTGKGVAKKRLSSEAMGDKKPKKGKLAPKSTRLDVVVVKKLELDDLVPPVKPYGGQDPSVVLAKPEEVSEPVQEAAAAETAPSSAANETPAAEPEMTMDMGNMDNATPSEAAPTQAPAEDGGMEMEFDMGDLSL